MSLKVVSEVEVADQRPEPQPMPVVEAKTEKQSAPLSAASPHMVAVLEEIRRILSARLGALLAMAGATCLTAAAMWIGTPMSLGASLIYDVLVFIPIAVIAYAKRA